MARYRVYTYVELKNHRYDVVVEIYRVPFFGWFGGLLCTGIYSDSFTTKFEGIEKRLLEAKAKAFEALKQTQVLDKIGVWKTCALSSSGKVQELDLDGRWKEA
jgi:hypothetical protein